MTEQLFGFLVIDKPLRKTSRDVVNVVQRLARPAKAGHAGTLDPLATGLLVVALGPATRLISMVQQGRKRYRATFRFGVTSDTGDLEGDVVEYPAATHVSRAALQSVLPEFTGLIDQVPPPHSAVHVKGRRAYELARRGEPVKLPPRQVAIEHFEIEAYDDSAQLATCNIECGAGTYIRSLGRDVAARLGTGCVMTALRRLAVGPFTLDEAVQLDELEARSLPQSLKPAAMAFADSTGRHELTDGEWEHVRHGRRIRPARFDDIPTDQLLPLLFNHRLAAVGRYDEDQNGIRPVMVFPCAGEPTNHQ